MKVIINHSTNYGSFKRIDLNELDNILTQVNEYLIRTLHGYELHAGEEITVNLTIKDDESEH